MNVLLEQQKLIFMIIAHSCHAMLHEYANYLSVEAEELAVFIGSPYAIRILLRSKNLRNTSSIPSRTDLWMRSPHGEGLENVPFQICGYVQKPPHLSRLFGRPMVNIYLNHLYSRA